MQEIREYGRTRSRSNKIFSKISWILRENIDFNVYIDGDVRNEDTNYGEKFWEEVGKGSDLKVPVLSLPEH